MITIPHNERVELTTDIRRNGWRDIIVWDDKGRAKVVLEVTACAPYTLSSTQEFRDAVLIELAEGMASSCKETP